MIVETPVGQSRNRIRYERVKEVAKAGLLEATVTQEAIKFPASGIYERKRKDWRKTAI